MSFKLLIAPLALGLLAGCNTFHGPTGSQDLAFGEALKYDMAVQTIDPDPVYSPDGAQPGDHGEKNAQAVRRYRTDAVKEAATVSTTSSPGGGGPN